MLRTEFVFFEKVQTLLERHALQHGPIVTIADGHQHTRIQILIQITHATIGKYNVRSADRCR
ncbi:MAG: hypothetical protein HQ518_19110 [Rhodopirellula sp.]|jgi:hypothetical protein|nr:hypothetical protein [Rhodopirellula sp.]